MTPEDGPRGRESGVAGAGVRGVPIRTPFLGSNPRAPSPRRSVPRGGSLAARAVTDEASGAIAQRAPNLVPDRFRSALADAHGVHTPIALARLDRRRGHRRAARSARPEAAHPGDAALRTPGRCDDMVQEVFLRAFRRWHTFKGEADPGTWLYAMAVRSCKVRGRRKGGIDRGAAGRSLRSMPGGLPRARPRTGRLHAHGRWPDAHAAARGDGKGDAPAR